MTADIDGDAVTISLTTTCLYSLTVASGVLSMAPAISNIGTCSVTLNLFDGVNNVPYLINIVTTNTPPSFLIVPNN